MKYRRLFLTFVITLVISFTATAREWWENFYVGADAQARRMDFKGGFGDNLLQHNAPQGNIYAGLKFNDCVGIELGYEATNTRSRMVTLTTGDIAAGAPITAMASPAIFKSKFKIKGPHVDLVGFYSLYENPLIQVFGSIGLSAMKGTAERQTLEISNMPMSMVRTLSEHKTVLRLMGGAQYMFDEHWGLRGSIGWVDTGKMVIFANDGMSGATIPEIKPKGSTIYGLGMLWIF